MKEIETDNNVGSKTPEEIKKALYQCGRGEFTCSECAYYDESEKRAGCGYVLNLHALTLIEQLECERDAAIEDIKVAATFLCQTCKKYHPAVIDGTKHFCDEIPADHFDDGAIACGMYEWRGAKEERMKKPEEIKKGLECLRNDKFPGEDCKSCPYLRHPVENTYNCNILERLNDAWDYIKQLESHSHKWTSVAEHLPQKPGKYLVYSKVGTMYTSRFDPDIHRRWPHFGKVGVTHWMPRPEEPKEE